MKAKNSENLYKETYKLALELYKKCEGVLIVFMVMCNLIKRYLVFTLMNQIWTRVISTLPNHFITDRNFFVLFQYPYVPLVGLIIVLLFSYSIAWEISGIMLIMEYNRQDKPVSLWKLPVLALKQTAYVLRPKNWLLSLFLLVVLPLTDIYAAAGMVSTFSVPEYIADFFYATPLTTAVFLLFSAGLFILAIRWFYVLPGVLLYGKDFSRAAKESALLMKKRKIRQIFEISWYTIKRALRLCIVPVLVIIVLFTGITVGLNALGYVNVPAAIYILKTFVPIFRAFFSIYIRFAVTCYLVANYRIFAQKYGLELRAELPDSAVKKKKIRTFRSIRPIFLVILIGLSLFMYVGTSIEFTENPEAMADTLNSAYIIAHKGYSSRAPENTLEAFRLACESSADMIELDIRESKDGIPIVIHNADLYTAAGEDKVVYDLTFEELQTYPIHYAFEESDFPDCRIPSLEQVLEEFGGKIPLLIEIKMDERTPDLPGKIVDLLDKYQCKEMCSIHSGSYEALEAVKEIDDSIPCGFIIALGTGSYESLPCADFFSVEHTFVNESMLDKIHSIGKSVYAWTVNETSSIAAMVSMDVDGIITDVPDNVYSEGFTYEELALEYLHQFYVQTVEGPNAVSEEYEQENY